MNYRPLVFVVLIAILSLPGEAQAVFTGQDGGRYTLQVGTQSSGILQKQIGSWPTGQAPRGSRAIPDQTYTMGADTMTAGMQASYSYAPDFLQADGALDISVSGPDPLFVSGNSDCGVDSFNIVNPFATYPPGEILISSLGFDITGSIASGDELDLR